MQNRLTGFDRVADGMGHAPSGIAFVAVGLSGELHGISGNRHAAKDASLGLRAGRQAPRDAALERGRDQHGSEDDALGLRGVLQRLHDGANPLEAVTFAPSGDSSVRMPPLTK